MDPNPRRSPDLEPGGAVPPVRHRLETAQTSGLSAPERRTRQRFPPTGTVTIAIVAAIVVAFVVVAVLLVAVLI